jgi:hypothetical protein
MLVRLLYASRAAAPISADDLAAIVRQSKANNPHNGITGVLCCSDNRFLQVLEGGRTAVNRLYGRIVADPRHGEVELLAYAQIGERRFAGWSMGQVNLARLNPGLLLKYSSTTQLDPYEMSGATALALLEELAATASIAGPA